ncbi:hypothetical protein CEXT_600081 [Caerostris extrusa]|uniref:Uncharacterized protein n=1 Tax=Caerostris extrusa TaxID=172846 RepID=A0AAV4RJY2_CAEEX|nr:hypothetical protein CEXT_600081 [Caerostris extrusa]
MLLNEKERVRRAEVDDASFPQTKIRSLHKVWSSAWACWATGFLRGEVESGKQTEIGSLRKVWSFTWKCWATGFLRGISEGYEMAK